MWSWLDFSVDCECCLYLLAIGFSLCWWDRLVRTQVSCLDRLMRRQCNGTVCYWWFRGKTWYRFMLVRHSWLWTRGRFCSSFGHSSLCLPWGTVRMPLKFRKCHLSWEQRRGLLRVGECRDRNRAVLQSTAPSNTLVEADPSEARALDPLLYALATRGFSPITSDSSLGALETAYRVDVSEAHPATCGALRVTSFLCGLALLGNRHGHVGSTEVRQPWDPIALSGM